MDFEIQSVLYKHGSQIHPPRNSLSASSQQLNIRTKLFQTDSAASQLFALTLYIIKLNADTRLLQVQECVPKILNFLKGY